MTFLKVMVVLAFLVLGMYYITHIDEVNNQASTNINIATEYFIDKSDEIITVVDYWANGPKQTYATSGSENIVFMDAIESTPIENHSNEIIVDLAIADDNDGVSIFKECEERFKTCVDGAHEQYGVFIIVNEVKAFNDVVAESYYDLRKSDYQPIFSTMNIDYPIIIVAADAAGYGKFAAICKDGKYPKDLNTGLPC